MRDEAGKLKTSANHEKTYKWCPICISTGWIGNFCPIESVPGVQQVPIKCSPSLSNPGFSLPIIRNFDSFSFELYDVLNYTLLTLSNCPVRRTNIHRIGLFYFRKVGFTKLLMREASIAEESPRGLSTRSTSAPPNCMLRNNIWGPAPVNQICSVSVTSYFFNKMMFDAAGW